MNSQFDSFIAISNMCEVHQLHRKLFCFNILFLLNLSLVEEKNISITTL